MSDEPTVSPDRPAGKLPVTGHVLCGWPLLLVVIGGAIGGGLGGMAYAINVKIYQSELPLAAKIVLNLLAGLMAVALWFGIVMAIQIVRKH